VILKNDKVKLQKTYAVTFITVILFSISMAYLESAVVVYLRMIYYPEGFSFPLKLIPATTYIIEAGREIATIIMLAAAGYLAGRNLAERIFYFLLSFGFWDIFYYIWLRVFLCWPATVFDYDVLFLIPVPWAGPVIAPVIISLTMIGISAAGIIFQKKGYTFRLNKIHYLLFLSGIILILTSFLWNAFTTDLLKDPDPAFQWGIFLAGEALLLAGVYLFFNAKRIDPS
jgi:hypothetical protein